MTIEEQTAQTADIIFLEEVPTTDLKSIRLLPLKLDERIVGVVGKLEDLVERVGNSNIENMKNITNIILDLSSILEKIQKTPSGSREVFERINDIYYKLDSTQLDDSKVYAIGEKVEQLEAKVDGILAVVSQPSTVSIDESFASDMEKKLGDYMGGVSNELAATLSGEAVKTEKVGRGIEQIGSKLDDISNTISGLSIEQIRDKLQMLSEIDKRSAYLEGIANELTSALAKESLRMDRLEKYIDQTSIESENLSEAIEQMKTLANRTKKGYSRLEREILDELSFLKEGMNAMIDRVIVDVLGSGDRKLPELESETGLPPALLEKRLKELAEVRVRLRGEGRDVICSLIR